MRNKLGIIQQTTTTNNQHNTTTAPDWRFLKAVDNLRMPVDNCVLVIPLSPQLVHRSVNSASPTSTSVTCGTSDQSGPSMSRIAGHPTTCVEAKGPPPSVKLYNQMCQQGSYLCIVLTFFALL